jgi:arylsulfatase
MMGRTPNIDRIARQGMLFTDHYGQPSCTAGRAAFIMGQMPIRTGMTTIGIPGSARGIQKVDPTLAEVLKPQGYATGQFGKNHLGDRNEFLPTVHGFDEWFGNLYHLNAEEEPEELDYPGQVNPKLRTTEASASFKQKNGPRGVLHAWATDVDDPSVDPKFGRVGRQKIEDTGPLTRKRMETFDREVLTQTLKWMDGLPKEKPFFCWFNSTAIHVRSRPANEYVQKAADEGRPEEDVVRARMIEHDEHVGALLKKLEEMGVADNTIVIYTTDNGAEAFSWPDGGTTPFRGEKNTNWEGGYRVPAMVRWPGLVPPRKEINEVFSAEDWCATLVAAAGEQDIKNKLLQGYDAAGKNFRVHLDGYDQRDILSGKGPDKRREFFYWTDDGNLAGLRYEQWKAVFMEQRAHGLDVWSEPLQQLRVPKLVNLRSDPFERGMYEAGDYVRWFVEHAFIVIPAQAIVAQHLQSFQEFPPRQRPGSFSVDQALEKLRLPPSSN